jgi:hypothetical protein
MSLSGSSARPSEDLRACHPSAQDWLPRPAETAFGSAHKSGFAMAMCDGSVRLVNYTIEGKTHR